MDRDVDLLDNPKTPSDDLLGPEIEMEALDDLDAGAGNSEVFLFSKHT